ncbi:hypothetical protein BDZ89DRAFT_471540 [Hymenopellis radicata]|nr:hypothetical protein BDZ89DRAFT_471540 [Hymenopellis radicata]
MPKSQPIHGGCLCGAIRYTIEFPDGSLYPPEPHTCQCTQCRKQSGALMLHFITLLPSQITWSGASPSKYSATPGITRGFCNQCGTCLSWYNEAVPEEFEIMTGTLDEDVLMGPQGKDLATVVNQAWCCRFIEGATDVIKDGKKWERGGDSPLLP